MNEELNISLEDYFNIIKERIWLIISITLVAVIIGAIMSFYIIKPTYQASASVIVGKPQSTTNASAQLNDVMMYQNLVKTYSEIAKSDLVIQGALDKLQTKLSVNQIKSSVTVTPQTGTQIIIISSKSKNPEEVFNVINAISTSFIESSKTLYPSGGDIQVIDKAVMPVSPIAPNKKLNMLISFFIGLMISVGIVFLLEYLDNTIKTESDVERYLGLPVLGAIPRLVEVKK